MSACAATGAQYRMNSCPHRITHRPTKSPRGLRRGLVRAGALAIGIAFAVAVTTLMFIGERWLLVEAPTSGIEYGVATPAAIELGSHPAAEKSI